MEPLALHDELQFALGEGGAHGLKPFFGRPVASVPEHNRAAAVLVFGNRALEIAVVEGVVLDLHGQPAVFRIKRGPLGHRPGKEGPLPLQPKVEMEMTSGVFLDHEAQGVRRHDSAGVPGRLGRL
ncbi:hypothetical protein D3C86_1686650 [compost metagenome]